MDEGNAIAVDGSGNVYVTGRSNATWTGPGGEAPLHAHSGGGDIVVLKLTSAGAYQWHTFYGSSSTDVGTGIAVDGSGNVSVTGYSAAGWTGPSGEVPLHAHSGFYDLVALKLTSAGAYQWHTFYGSSDYDEGYGIAVDGSGNVSVTGRSDATWSGPSGEAPLHAHSGGWDLVVLKLAPNTTPDPFTFTDVTGVPLSTEQISSPITVSGITAPALISIVGGEYELGSNPGVWTSIAGTVSNGDTVRVRHTSAATYSTAVDTTLTIGGVPDTFTSTTEAPVGIPTLSEWAQIGMAGLLIGGGLLALRKRSTM